MPKRIQMRRDRPWRHEHPNAVIVARPSKWGNPHRIGDVGVPDAETAVKLFAAETIPNVETLRGKDLACWCRLDQPCHADVLIKLANSEK